MRKKKLIIIAVLCLCVAVTFGVHFRNGVNTGHWTEISRTDVMADTEDRLKDYENREEFGSSYLKSPISLKFDLLLHNVELTDGNGRSFKCKYKSDYKGTGDPQVTCLRAVGTYFKVDVDGHTLSLHTWNPGAADAGNIESETLLMVLKVDGKEIESPDNIILKRKE